MGNASGTITGAGERREFVVDQPGRLDAVLAAAFPDITRARVQRLIASGDVLRNGAPARKSEQVLPGDTLAIELVETLHAALAATGPLTVLYEDADLLAIDKPAGLATHGAPGDTAPSVAGWFIATYPAEAARFDADHPGIVHRLDKETSGVLLLAKTPAAQAALGAAFEARTTHKSYLAVCEGVPRKARAVVDAPLGRHPGDRTRMAVVHHGRAARTEYELLGSGAGRSLLLVQPVTGRTHQIRVHLAAVNIPVADDPVYGRAPADGTRRHLLHAWRIVVPHPAGELTVTAPLPPEMAAAVRAIGLEELASSYSESVLAAHLIAASS